jgi:hypothetical protein
VEPNAADLIAELKRIESSRDRDLLDEWDYGFHSAIERGEEWLQKQKE